MTDRASEQWSRDIRCGPYKVNSLVLLPDASALSGAVRWDPARSLWNGGMFLGALVLAPAYFSWGALTASMALLFARRTA